MSINIGKESSEITIYKDEQGRYKTYIKNTELQANGEKEDIYMSMKVQFRKGIEVKNRSKIEVTNGWITCYRIPKDEVTQSGKTKYKYFDKLFVNEFNLLQEGVDENLQPKQEKIEEQQQNDFSFSDLEDDLPF